MSNLRLGWALVVLLTPIIALAQPARSESKDSKDKEEIKITPPAKSQPGKHAVDIADIINNLEYPELMVVPRASERLRIEAKDEDDSWYYTHWTIEFSGLATLALGTVASSYYRESLSATEKADAKTVTTVTQAVGLGWITAGFLIGMQKPYRSALNVINKYPGKDERSTLARERLAEENLESPARLMRVMKWASVLTNFGACALTATYLSDQGRLGAGVAAALSFLPLIFEDHAIVVFEKHLEYKKKIYGPVSSVGLMSDGNHLVPSTVLTWNF